MPQLPQLYPYKAGPIETLVLPGEVVGLYVNKIYYFYRVIATEGILRSDPMEIDLGALAAGAQSAITQLNLLEMPDREFGQFRCIVLDDIAVDLFQGRGVRRFNITNRTARYTLFSQITDPDCHNGEFYVREDDWAFMQASNLTDYALTQARVAFWGFRYVLEVLPEFDWKKGQVPEAWTRILASGRE